MSLNRLPGQRRVLRHLGCSLLLALAGCEAFNPAFLNLVAPEIAASTATLPNAPGFVVLALKNNVEVDGQLISFLQPRLNLSDAELATLRPRIRLRIRITHADGTFQVIEMIDGSGQLVDPEFNAQATPDLNQNDLTNVVARCDVSSIQLEPGTNIEVFIPVTLTAFELVEVTRGDQTTAEFQPRGTITPRFQPLEVDDVDEDGNVILRRNVDLRDVFSPTTNVVCGSVVAIVVDGVLSVPFFRQASSDPSFDQDDPNAVASIGGRFEFRVSIQ